MPASRSLNIVPDTPLHKKLCAMISSRINLARKGQELQHEKWRKAEQTTMAFIPESEADSIRKNNRELKGTPSYTTIQVPYSYALLMSAHTYWTSVFFSRSPVHQFTGRHGEGEQQIQAMEALIGYQFEVGQFIVPYYVWLYDTGKYGLGVLGSYWDKRILHYGQIVEMQDPSTGQMALYQATQQVEGYQGNCVYNISVWDFLPDPRVPVKRFQEGEFVAVRKRLGWNQILQREAAGYFINKDKVAGHASDKTGQIGGATQGFSELQRPLLNEDIMTDENTKHPAGGSFFEFYVDLVPREWGVGNTNYPQKWCFTITEDLGLICGATPLGLMHCQFPIDILEAEVEGYGLYSRGVPEIMEPIQNTVDWLLNSHFYNVRQCMNNQFIVDPSKLVVKDVQNSGPGFIWRLRPEAYGTDIRTMFHQVQVQDVTGGHMADFQAMFGIGERTIGINDQIMGSLNTGGTRKTATEVRTTTAFGVNRLKTVSEYMSGMGMAPHSQKLVQTSQQMYDVSAKLRRVGSFAQEAGMSFIQVSPRDIVGFYDLVPVDGSLPIDRMAQANLWKELMGNLRMMPPQVAMGYDWTRIFAWVANLAGLKNVNQFKIQLIPDQQAQAQAQQGNVIPMVPPGAKSSAVQPGNAASTAAGLPQMGGAAAGVPEYAGS